MPCAAAVPRGDRAGVGADIPARNLTLLTEFSRLAMPLAVSEPRMSRLLPAFRLACEENTLPVQKALAFPETPTDETAYLQHP